VAQPAHLSAVPEAGRQPQLRQLLPDVVGVALVEVGAGDAALDLLGDPADQAREQRGFAGRRRVAGLVPVAGALSGSSHYAASASTGRTRGPRAARSRSARAKKFSSSSLVRSGHSTCGTWPQPSSVTCSALGSHLRTCRSNAAGTSGSWSPQMNSAGGSSSDSRG